MVARAGQVRISGAARSSRSAGLPPGRSSWGGATPHGGVRTILRIYSAPRPRRMCENLRTPVGIPLRGLGVAATRICRVCLRWQACLIWFRAAARGGNVWASWGQPSAVIAYLGAKSKVGLRELRKGWRKIETLRPKSNLAARPPGFNFKYRSREHFSRECTCFCRRRAFGRLLLSYMILLPLVPSWPFAS